MSYKQIFPFLLCTLLICGVQAQTRPSSNITITGDVAVSQLVAKHIEFNEKVKTVPGYRIQVASLSGGNAKNRAFELKDKIKVEFPSVETYVIYVEPNFRVKVGDFRTRLEAYAFLQVLKDSYPGTILRDDIYPIKIDWDNLIPETDADAEN